MQTNGNTSPEQEKNRTSLDSILGEYENNNTPDERNEETESSMDKLDKIFRQHEEDLEWLEDFMVEKAPEEEEEDGGEVVEEILAENADEQEEDGETEDGEIITDVIEEEIAEQTEEEIEAPISEEDDNDGSTKVFGAVKEKEEDDGVGFEIFEADTEDEEEFPTSEEGGDNVDEFLSKLFSKSEDNAEEEKVQEEKTEKKPKKVKTEHEKIADELGTYKEIDMSDAGAVNEGKILYATKKRRSLISLFCVAVFMLIGLYIELAPIAGLPHPEVLSANNSTLYALIDLQILCFAAMFTLDSLGKGLVSIIDKRFSPAACALSVAAVSAIQAIICAIFAGSDIRLFCSVGILALFALCAYDYLCASADDKAYRIASSASNKFGAFEIETTSPDCAPFASHIDMESAKAISVKKGKIYKGFVERNQRRPVNEKNLGRLALAALIVSIIVGAFMAIAQNSFYQGFTSGVVVFVSSLPINIFFVSALPKYIASVKGKQLNAALIGQNASEEYKGLSVVSFEDTEVFLPKDVRISSIKTYGGMALDEAVVLMSKIYGKVGGPLSKIFAKMVDIKDNSSEIELVKVYPDALDLKVDGKYVCLATASFLSANGIRVISDSVDTAFEQSHGSILYMVCSSRVLAKFYIKYSVNPNFERTLAELHEANLCAGIKTLDPCINNELVFGCLEKANYALCVVKGTEKDIPDVNENVSSGVVALGSVHNFLEMLLVCERTGRNVKINNVIKLISTVLCLVLSTAFVLSNSALNVIFCLIIQIFWLLPVAVISYLNK